MSSGFDRLPQLLRFDRCGSFEKKMFCRHATDRLVALLSGGHSNRFHRDNRRT
jgi:hypothetical protein